jgi:hypothetical protein
LQQLAEACDAAVGIDQAWAAAGIVHDGVDRRIRAEVGVGLGRHIRV